MELQLWREGGREGGSDGGWNGRKITLVEQK